MAEQLKLVRMMEFIPGETEVSLMDYVDGFNVAYEGWRPKTRIDRDGKIRETLSVRARGTSVDALATNLQKLADKQREVYEYVDGPASKSAVWLRVQLPGETGVRQALVVGMEHESASSVYDVALRKLNRLNEYRIGLERMPWWEATTLGTITGSSVSIFGGTFAYAGIAGDVGARLARVNVRTKIIDTALGGTVELFPDGQVWIGWRGTRFHGTPSAWTSRKSLYVASALGGPDNRGVAAQRATADIYALGGTMIYWNLAGAAVGETLCQTYVRMDEITATPEAMYGEFQVLLRAKIGNTTGTGANGDEVRFNVQMVVAPIVHNYGVGGLEDFRLDPGAQIYPRVPVSDRLQQLDGTKYHLYDLGRVQYPPAGRVTANGALNGQIGIAIYGEISRIASGTPWLCLDSLIFIPTGEGMYWSGRRRGTSGVASANLQGNYASINLWGWNGPGGESSGLIAGTLLTAVQIMRLTEQPQYEVGLPPSNGMVVVAADNNGEWNAYPAHPRWTVDVELNTVSRWQEMRGNE